MKKLKIVLLTVLLCLLCIETKTLILPKDEIKTYIKWSNVDFMTTFKLLMHHEGYYANHPNDRGKETYSGISRTYNSDWYGWRYVDQYKAEKKLKIFARIPELDIWVLDYYLDIWVKEHFYELKDQDVASYVFDFRINGTIGAKLTQKVLNELGCKVIVSNHIDSLTIAAINSVSKDAFLNSLSNRRHTFYTNIVKRDSTQKVFLNHWLKRSQLNKQKL